MAAVRRPTVPAPSTRAVEPVSGCARFLACIATDSGSRRAAASNEMFSGSLLSAGQYNWPRVSIVWCSLVTPYRRVINSVLERALEVRERLRAAPEPHLLAEVISPFATCGALSTGDADLQGDAVSHCKATHLRANGYHDTGGLMTEREWLAGTEITICELLVVRHIRATYTRGTQGYL